MQHPSENTLGSALRLIGRGAGFFGIGATTALALVVGGFWLLASLEAESRATGLPWPPSLIFLGLLLAFAGGFVGWAFLPRWPPRAPTQHQLRRSDAPALFELVEAVARRVGAPIPLRISLHVGTEIIVDSDGPSLPFARRRGSLILGVAPLQSHSVQQLEALLVRALVRVSRGRSLPDRFAEFALYNVHRQLQFLERFHLPTRPWQSWFDGLERARSVHRGRGLVPYDRIASRYVDASVLAGSLARFGAAEQLYLDFIQQEVRPILDTGYVPADLFEGFRLWLDVADAHGAGSEPGAALAESLAALGHPLAPRTRGEGPLARTLLADPIREEQSVGDSALSHLRNAEGWPLDPVRWDQVGPVVWATQYGNLAERLTAQFPGDADLSTLLRWLGSPVRNALAAAAALGPESDGEPDEAERNNVLLAGVAGWVGRELASRGWRWETAPGLPVELVSARGRRVPIRELVAPAIEDPEELPALRQALVSLDLLAPHRTSERVRLH